MCRILVLAVTLLGALGAVLRCEEPVLPRVLTPGIMDLSVSVGGKARQLQFEFLPPAEPGTPDIGVLYESKEVWISTDFRRIVEGPSQYTMEYKPYPEFVGRADPKRGACLIESAKLVADAVEGDRPGDFVLTGTYRMMIQEGNEDPRWSGVRQFRIAGPQASMMGLFRWGHFGYRSRDWTTCIPSTDDPDFTTLFDGAKEGAKVGLSGGWGYVLAPVDFENHPDGPWPILSSLVEGWGAIGEVVYTHPIVRYERIHYTLDSARATVADALASESFSPRHRNASFFPARFGFDETEAFGSIVRYRFQIRPDSMTRLDWVEVFIPAEPALPSDYRQMSWNVPAGATESPLFTIDPFEVGNPHRFPTVPGTYEVRLSFGELRVDANRDGQIKLASEDDSDATSKDKPFRFWINDDNDQSKIYTWGNAVIPNLAPPGFISPGLVPLPAFYEREQDDQPVSGESEKNCDDLFINGTRDLEDFARLWIDVSSLRNMITGSNPALQIGLKWTASEGSPAIRVFRAAESTGGTGYLFNSTVAEHQVDQTGEGYGNALGSGMIDTSSTYVIPQIAFADLSESQPGIRLLFEGCRAGRGQLKLVILNQDGTEIGEGPGVWMDLREPNEFVERFSCGDDHLGEVVPVVRHASSAIFTTPTTDEERDYVLYVHGFNMADFEKQRWIETAFKRLYWLGYKGRVGGFTWPCSQSTPTFDASEENAWLSAAQLKTHLQNLKAPKNGYRVHVIGHSQGNVVMGEALRLWGAEHHVRADGSPDVLVSTYIASQAAIAAHCYSADAPLMPDYQQDTPNVYACYWQAGDSARFPQKWPTTNPPYLAAATMQSTAGRWVNFYNPQDYALTSASGGICSWEKDQRLKPDNFYNWSVTNGFFKGWVPFETAYSFPDHRYVIFSYCAEARSVALGTIPTGAPFTSFTNLQIFGFADEHLWHSGQFRAFNASRYRYWQVLMSACDLTPYDPNQP